MSSGSYTEEQLERMEREANPAVIPELVRAVRAHQRELDNLRLSVEVARKDREELRFALVRMQEELKRARAEEPLR